MAIDSKELNRKIQETNIIYLAVVSAIFLVFWFLALPRENIMIPLGVILLAFLAYFYIAKPGMEKTISEIGKGK